ncbi:biotin synthase BioB [Clostridium gasigenes]|uniref:biotin synthase BioB n=1 Tax=Clostridium gasigenes TaxID=94869 RepID=UPI001C0CEDF3|nr:biotin synthase BioB [Clostridium gasigenes]MBU3109593.1 biotin synthase BioB [Clostridium gasigenes]
MSFVCILKDRVLQGYEITKEEALRLYLEPKERLYSCANEIRKVLVGDKVDLCSIINGKSGRCSEDCRYCAQSIYFNTGVNEYKLLSYDEIKSTAKENEEAGVDRFSIVTSGKGLVGNDFERVINYYERLNAECSISLCASHGILEKSSLIRLKKTGVKRYHHNIETSKQYYRNICSTHSYEDRINTILSAKEAGLEVCSGGIIGMGESKEDRVDMAIELRMLKILSIPINALMAIKGTPLENEVNLTEEEILRTIAIFRFINPKANIRLAAGRNLLTNYGENAFKSGANATITGNLLTTCGNNIEADRKMILDLGLKMK